jgi:glucan phosphoethanolaminetransferase (alkaline phosphatase superfamily)
MWARAKRAILTLEIVVLSAGLYRISTADSFTRIDQALAIGYLLCLILLPICICVISLKSLRSALACLVAGAACLYSAIFCYVIALHLPTVVNLMNRLNIRMDPFLSYFFWLSVMACLIGAPSFVIVWIHVVRKERSGSGTGTQIGTENWDAAK